MDLANKQAIEVCNYVRRLEDHVAMLRKALAFYADRNNWIEPDYGATACVALESESPSD
jgi:hypothetical protein